MLSNAREHMLLGFSRIRILQNPNELLLIVKPQDRILFREIHVISGPPLFLELRTVGTGKVVASVKDHPVFKVRQDSLSFCPKGILSDNLSKPQLRLNKGPPCR